MLNVNTASVFSTIAKPLLYLRKCFSNHTAWLIACAHATWFLLAVANMSPPNPALADFLDKGGWSSATLFAGRPFHFHYESIVLKLLLLCDMPSMLVSGIALTPLVRLFHLRFYYVSFFDAGLFLVVATMQWLFIGNFIHDSLQQRRWGSALTGFLRRHFIGIVVLIAVFTVLTAPMVNARSKSLGSRHSGISFN